MKENICFCFADKGDKCLVVLHKQCKGCNFYKSKAKKRLKSLDKTSRIGIAEKYGVKGIV